MNSVTCPHCARSLPLAAFLEAATGYSGATDSGSSSCPWCSGPLEFRIRSGVLELGFTDWAGSLHFDAVSTHRVRGLRKRESDEGTVAEVGGRVFLLGRVSPVAMDGSSSPLPR